MCHLKCFVLFVFVYFRHAHAGVSTKECPIYEPVNNFNFTALMSGIWHEVARYPNYFQTANCVSYELVPIEENKRMLQLLGSLNISKDSPDFIETILEKDPNAGDKGIVLHEISYGTPRNNITIREYILAMDYNKFYISAECQYDKRANTFKEYVWVHTRSKIYDEKLQVTIDNFLKSSKYVDPTKLVWYCM